MDMDFDMQPVSGSVSLAPEQLTTGFAGQPQQASLTQPAAQPVLQQASSSVAQQVAGQVAWSAAEQTAGLLKRGAGEIRIYIEKNHYSVHVLSLCGGIALVVVSFLGLLNILAPLTSPLSYFLHFYQLCFGIVLCVIDGPGDKTPRMQAMVVQYAPFLHNNAGRSLFYFFVSCLEGSQEQWMHIIVGWYFFAISVMHVVLKVKSIAAGGPSEPDSREQHLLP
mmetsp:Transcript_109368/g.193736  ORF Transcript_109368/g.193736 Transcript_109368/m.193736 type:complete len:222 (+) Transcript_109368:41-706(+)